jgi:small ligand-binding sensory domain FIST
MQIDLAFVFVSSLYTEPLSQVVPWVLSSIIISDEANTKRRGYYGGVKHVIGGSAGGIIGTAGCVEIEGTIPAVSITLALLPDVTIHTFHIKENKKGVDNVVDRWISNIGDKENEDKDPIFMILPTPAFQNDVLQHLLYNIQYTYPKSCIFGGITSTVSSLSRARIFIYSSPTSNIDDRGDDSGVYQTTDTTINQ